MDDVTDRTERTRLVGLCSMPEVVVVNDIAARHHVRVLLVGGAVRDALLNKPVHDLDFAVLGNSVRLARTVANQLDAAFYLMDAERGTARVIVSHKGRSAPALNMDFAVRRGATWEEDLMGRDFSLNAIAVDETGAILDPSGGRTDLTAGVIRQVTPHAISDDPVRAMRAVRMEHALCMRMEPETARAVRSATASLHIPSPERVRDELMKMLALPNAAQAIRRLDGLGLLRELIPEMEPLRVCTQTAPHQFPVLEHTFVVLDYLDDILRFIVSDETSAPEWLSELTMAPGHRASLQRQLITETSNERTRIAILRLAALLHDIAKPANRSVGDDGRVHFYGHEEDGSVVAAARGRTLKLSADEVAQIRTTVAHHMRPNQMSRDGNAADITTRAIYRYINTTSECAPEIALFCIADGMGKAGAASASQDYTRRAKISALLIKAYYDRFGPDAAPRPLITGNDVIGLGVQQGHQIGAILSAVREAQMVGEIDSYEAAIAIAKGLIEKGE